MTSASEKPKVRRGRIFPDHNWSPERIARDKAERAAFGQRCRVIFELVQPELIEDHYNWFIVIEPESGDYFIDASKEVAIQKASEKYPIEILGTLRINETGACGQI